MSSKYSPPVWRGSFLAVQRDHSWNFHSVAMNGKKHAKGFSLAALEAATAKRHVLNGDPAKVGQMQILRQISVAGPALMPVFTNTSF